MDDIVVKKMFIDTYNQILSFITSKQGKGIYENWNFPPTCTQDNTYAYALFFYKLVMEGQWKIDWSDTEDNSDDNNDTEK